MSFDSSASDDSGLDSTLLRDPRFLEHISRLRGMMSLVSETTDDDGAAPPDLRERDVDAEIEGEVDVDADVDVDVDVDADDSWDRPDTRRNYEDTGITVYEPEPALVRRRPAPSSAKRNGDPEDMQETSDESSRGSSDRRDARFVPPPGGGAAPLPLPLPPKNEVNPSAGHAQMNRRLEPEGEERLGAFTDDEDDDDDQTYVVTWAQGVLGLAFRGNPHGETIIRRVNRRTGTAEGLQIARAGDVLISINDESVAGRTTEDIMEQFMAPTLPLRLEFQTARISENDGSHRRSSGDINPGSSASSATSNSIRRLDTPPVSDPASAVVNAPTSSPPVLASSNEYEVVWNDGPLGCALKAMDGVPVVKAATGSTNPRLEPSVAQISDGDVLVEINGLNTDGIGFRAVVSILKAGNKPIRMRFRRGGSRGGSFSADSPAIFDDRGESLSWTMLLGPNQYSVQWQGGPLGIQIKGGSDGNVVVSKFTGNGDARLVSQISIGDILVRIGETSVQEAGVEAAFELLKHVEKPVTLVLEKIVYQRGGFNPNASVQSVVPNLRQLRLNERRNPRPSAQQQQCAPISEELLRSAEQIQPVSREDDLATRLPRFSEIETGRVTTTSVAAVPPPPSYDEVFSTGGLSSLPLSPQPQQPAPAIAAGPEPSPSGWVEDEVRDIAPPLAQGYEDAPPRYDEMLQQSVASSYDSVEIERLRQIHMDMERRKIETPAPAPQRQEIWVRWCEGPLGITFRRTQGQIVVSRLTGAGRSPRLEQLYPGDWLVKFGNEGVGLYMSKDLRLSETVAIIKQLPKPVDLWFLVP